MNNGCCETRLLSTSTGSSKNSRYKTRSLEKKHTGSNIAEILTECADEWNIKDKVNALVTDNAANMTVAARRAEVKHHIPCFAHTLNLTAKKGLKKYEETDVLD